ncbi:septum site-determining protein Ssd [Parafrankia sp. FMc2]|uniref:septum site-determining protein Ssd n=1 Tax=Parafrankia sp. FMc2 TaxID=3233196 RepID=UPI0034D5FD4A
MTPAKPLTPTDDAPRGRPLIVTDSPDLLDDLLRLAAAAGAAVTVVPTARAAGRYWAKAPLVVVGADRAAACVAADLPARSDTVLVGTDIDDRRTWSLALLLNAEHVVFLPEAETWLVNLLSRAADAARSRSRTVGVLGGRGGVGATTLAAALARAGLRHRVRSVLLEMDPFGGLAIGPDGSPGSDSAPAGGASAAARGRRGVHGIHSLDGAGAGRTRPRAASDPVPGSGPGSRSAPEAGPGPLDGGNDLLDHFLAGPPMLGGDLPVLSWDRDQIPVLSPPAVSALFATARGSADLIVVDLPRSADAAADVGLFLCETVLIVVTADPPACAAAIRIAAHATRTCSDVRLVVRLPEPGPTRHAGTGLASRARTGAPTGAALARAVAADVGLPLGGMIQHEPAATPTVMAAPDRRAMTGPEGNRPTTHRPPGNSGSDPTDRTTGRPSKNAGAGAEPAEPGAGESIIQFSDRFLADLGLSRGEHP